MDSFSNENAHDFQPLPQFQSTPKVSRKRRNVVNTAESASKKSKFACSFCGKVYQVKFYYDKHVASHGDDNNNNEASITQTCATNDKDKAVNITQNITFSMMNDSTPASQNNLFKKPAAAAPNKKRVTVTSRAKTFTCTYCLRGYVCTNSYKNHMRTHAMQDGAALFPKAVDIIASAVDIAVQALTKAACAPSADESGIIYRQLAGEIASKLSSEEWRSFCTSLCDKLTESIDIKKCLLPSAILSVLMGNAERVLSDREVCDDLLSLLVLPEIFDGDTKCQFLLEFTLNFVAEIFSFISKNFRSRYQTMTLRKVPEIDDEDRQVIFYIGGSILRGYLRVAFRYKTSSRWELLALIIKAKLLCDQPSSAQDASWTRSVDRGGLLYLNDSCQKFFVAVAEVIFLKEGKDGSIDYDRVIKHVSNSDLSVMWDQMIVDSLPEEESLFLMNDVVRLLCKTCGRGFAKRRLNFLRDKPLISMPTRHTAASKKTS